MLQPFPTFLDVSRSFAGRMRDERGAGKPAPEVPHVKSGGDPKDSYRPIIEALNSALRAEEDMSDPTFAPYRGVLRALTPGSERPGPEAHKLLMLEGVGRLLASIGRRDGALLVLEDLHWADADTLGLIEYVVENRANDRVACLLTLRDEPGSALELAEAIAARRTASSQTSH